MKICIVGGGNIGTALAVDLAQANEVFVLTNHPELWSKEVRSYDSISGITLETKIEGATSNPEIAIKDVDIVIVTVPSYVMEQEIKKISPFLKKRMILCIMPGSGGVEFFVKDLIRRGITIVGFDRVTHVSRISVYGREAIVAKKQSVRFSTLSNNNMNLRTLLENLLGMDCINLKNYLSVTFTPSNPLVHTSRLFDMFSSFEKDAIFERNFYFYREWTNRASEYLLGCDDELQQLVGKINASCDMEELEVIPLKKHYEVSGIESLTNKIISIKSMENILSPMKNVDGKYYIDWNSRYFLEDFSFGLNIIKSFYKVFDIKSKYTDEILNWYYKVSNTDNIKMDLLDRYNLKSVSDIENFYKL